MPSPIGKVRLLVPRGTSLSLFPFTALPISPPFNSRGRSLLSRLGCVSAGIPKLLADVPPCFSHKPSLVPSHPLRDGMRQKHCRAAPLFPPCSSLNRSLPKSALPSAPSAVWGARAWPDATDGKEFPPIFHHRSPGQLVASAESPPVCLAVSHPLNLDVFFQRHDNRCCVIDG